MPSISLLKDSYLPNRKELEKLVNRILEDDNKDKVIM